ncbi:membrane bound O-acyl transferase family-domain-containing protein [Phaeosphaeria sp. MPI-PUGE-AT-0046c]|nr:membrane bound O-acyl transferase family-domain-containing protein [Phaeosphaeria sp. MPI-PUGE-AT-0046c]
MPPPPNATELFSEQRIRFFSRLGEVSREELAVRVTGSFVYWCNIYAVLHGLFSFAAVLSVGLGLSKIENWKPLFGSLRDATSLRGFWGKFWHQSLRDNLYEPATFLSDKVLRLSPGILARYTKLFMAFLISGLMHAFAEVATGLDLQHGAAVRFFCTQATGIILEDAAIAIFSHGKRTKGTVSSSLLCSLGYIWVVCFMAWSTPAWFYPDAVRGPKVPFLPFSLVTKLRW